MPGFLPPQSPAAGGAQPTPQPLPQSGGAASPGADSNVSPEEQAQYDQFVTNGLKLMMQGEGAQARINPAVLARMQDADDPKQGVAGAAAMIILQLMQSAKKSGEKLSGDVIFHGGVEIIEHLIAIAEKAGIHEFSEEDMEGVMYLTLDMVREQATAAGLIDSEALKQDFAQIAAADKQGTLGQLLPGLPQDGDAGPAPPPAPQDAQPMQQGGQ